MDLAFHQASARVADYKKTENKRNLFKNGFTVIDDLGRSVLVLQHDISTLCYHICTCLHQTSPPFPSPIRKNKVLDISLTKEERKREASWWQSPSRLKWTSFAAALVLRRKCEDEECERKDLLRQFGSARGNAESEEAIAANDYKKKKLSWRKRYNLYITPATLRQVFVATCS